MGGEPHAATVPVAPPLFLNAGHATIHVYIVAPCFRGVPEIIWFRTLVLPTVAEFISVAFSAHGAGEGECHFKYLLLSPDSELAENPNI